MPKGDNLKGKGGLKFGEGQRTDLGGRKKNRLNEVWKILLGEHEEEERELILSKEEKYRLIEQLFDLNSNQLQGIINNDSTPVFVVNIALAIMTDMQEGRTVTIDKYWDRFYGKAASNDKVDITSNGETIKETKTGLSIDDLISAINGTSKE